ncbi:MAG: succinylglutamate desuccinylase/aspartoacylase family protein [Pseudomonadota bacterium]
MTKKSTRPPFEIGGQSIDPGTRRTVKIEIGFLADHTLMGMTAHVIHGRAEGPVMFVSGAIHGDEILGVEIIRRLMGVKTLNRLKGTLILVPVVNAYGFLAQSRYLPDRRDLNRSFPGSSTGSLAGQLAHTFVSEIVARCSLGIDLHTAAIHRDNLPQIRANLDDPDVLQMAEAFGTSIMLHAHLREGSLRQAAGEMGCKTLLYEAGEALRYDEKAIRIGVRGVVGVLRNVGMVPLPKASAKPSGQASAKRKASILSPIRSDRSTWQRAPIGGVMRASKGLGDRVRKGEVIAQISDPLGEVNEAVEAPITGIIIGRTNLPVVNRGDALFHVARVKSASDAEDLIEALSDEVDEDPLFDGVEIV